MMPLLAFNEDEASKLLAETHRWCCVCWRWRGFRIELHHIAPGDDSIANALPVCFDCHAEIESKGPRGRHFSAAELVRLRDDWLKLCRERPEVLVAAARGGAAEAGPLEALLSELEYNAIAVGGTLDESVPFLKDSQFTRAIEANAFAALNQNTTTRVFEAQRLIGVANRIIAKLNHMAPEESRGAALYRASKTALHSALEEVRRVLPTATEALMKALGRSATGADEPT